MPVDKSWIHLKDYWCNAYWNGAIAFAERAKQYVNDQGKVKCPCLICRNVLHQTVETLEAHLIDNGFDSSYTNWIFHGEVAEIRLPRNDVHIENIDQRDEMVDILQDFVEPENADSGENEYDMGDDVAMRPSVSGQQYNDAATWGRCCDLFDSPEFRAMSERNATNRARQLAVSKQGAVSIAHKRYKKRNPSTGKLQPVPESFEDRYFTERTGWPSPQFGTNYNKMLEIHNTQSQASCQSSSSSSASVTDAHIADEVLGTHRRFRRGIGHKLSKSASSTRSASPDFPPPVPEDVQRYIHESQQYMMTTQQREVATQEIIAQQQRSIEAQAAQIAHMQMILSTLVPDVNMSTSAPIHLGSTSTSFGMMPLPPPLPPRFAHPPPTHQENDSEETEDEDLGF